MPSHPVNHQQQVGRAALRQLTSGPDCVANGLMTADFEFKRLRLIELIDKSTSIQSISTLVFAIKELVGWDSMDWDLGKG